MLFIKMAVLVVGVMVTVVNLDMATTLQIKTLLLKYLVLVMLNKLQAVTIIQSQFLMIELLKLGVMGGMVELDMATDKLETLLLQSLI